MKEVKYFINHNEAVMEEEYIKKIVDSYNFKGLLKSINTITSHPHIKRMSFDSDYIIKKVNKIYCKDINLLYDYFSSSDYVELPMKTVDNQYGLLINNELFIVYKWLDEIDEKIKPNWWANALTSIHNIHVNKDDFTGEFSIDDECFSLLKKASSLFSADLSKCINELLKNYYSNLDAKNIVLSHGDPYDSNVMKNQNHFGLIDTDGGRLLPEEYDIARLLLNEVNRENDLKLIDNYINTFFSNYGNEIDINYLKQVYVMDLLRSFSWLNLITKNKNRDDIDRQMKELIQYKESILSEKHNKVLMKL